MLTTACIVQNISATYTSQFIFEAAVQREAVSIELGSLRVLSSIGCKKPTAINRLKPRANEKDGCCQPSFRLDV